MAEERCRSVSVLRGLVGVRVVQVELVEVRRRPVLVELDRGLEWFVEHKRAAVKGGEAGGRASVSGIPSRSPICRRTRCVAHSRRSSPFATFRGDGRCTSWATPTRRSRSPSNDKFSTWARARSNCSSTRSGAPWRLPAPSTTGRRRRPRSSERAANRPGAVSGTRQSNEPRCDERARGKARFRDESGTELPESLIVCVIRRRSSLRERFQFAGTSDKRLKGLEPSTFCMANGTASGLSTTFHLQMTSISVLTTPPSTKSDAGKFR